MSKQFVGLSPTSPLAVAANLRSWVNRKTMHLNWHDGSMDDYVAFGDVARSRGNRSANYARSGDSITRSATRELLSHMAPSVAVCRLFRSSLARRRQRSCAGTTIARSNS
jgi:hypothetical protein